MEYVKMGPHVFDSHVLLRIASMLALSSLAACSSEATSPAAAETARRGEIVFTQHCAACHIVQPGKWKNAPSLRNIIGRKAGSTSFPYSPAFRRVDFVWNRETLDTFLTDPRRVVPDNGMAFFGLPDSGARSDLIAYLASVSEPAK